MDFGNAIILLKKGKRIKRAGWNGKTQYIELVNIGNKAMTFVGPAGTHLGLLASQADMLADDWEECIKE